MDLRRHELAGQRRDLRPLHLHRADPRHRGGDRGALHGRALGCSRPASSTGEGSNAVQLLPPLSWIAVIAIVTLIGGHAGGRRLAILVGLCFLYLAVFGQWESAMVTLASILVAVPLGVAGGLLLGLAGYRWPRFERAMRPVLDLMQTVPVFAYLVPILFLFGFGPVAVDRRDHHLRHAADGAGHHPRAAGRADRDPRPRPHDRLHPPADDLEGDGAVGAARADGRRQPGHHAVAQHGDHRLDDRRRRPRLRRARRAPPARHRRGHRGRRWRSSCWRSPSTGFRQAFAENSEVRARAAAARARRAVLRAGIPTSPRRV